MNALRALPWLSFMLVALIAGAACLAWTIGLMRISFGWQDAQKALQVGLFYGAGLGLGVFTALVIDSLVLQRIRRRRLRQFLFLAGMIILIVGFTAALLALQYRLYYSQWHEPFLSTPWMYQTFFTSVGAVAQYGIFGIRYHGIGALLIVLTTWWWAMRTRH